MSTIDKTLKQLQVALKLSGFTVRREFCSLILDKFDAERIDLLDRSTFDECIKKLCHSLESQCIVEHSIEREHVERAIDVCLHSGYDQNETVFRVIGAFDFPKFSYDPDRKQYMAAKRRSVLLSGANTNSQLYLDRYTTVLQRTRRNLPHIVAGVNNLRLQTVDYLLTLSHCALDGLLILGSLLQVAEGKYYLEDPTGIVQLDLTHAKYHGGFFVENSFMLVNGYYEDKILQVSSIIQPSGEKCDDTRHCYGTLNYFGGPSITPLKDSVRLGEHLQRNRNDMIMFFSDVWLDHPLIFEKLETLFDGIQATPPVAFIFMGNFLSESHCSDMIDVLKKLFKHFAELIVRYPNLVNRSQFVFVPGPGDPCTTHMIPRFALPACVTNEMTRIFSTAQFTTNPCRIQYCTRELTVFRADILPKLLQGTLHKPTKEQIADYLTRTIICQGHLSPLSLNTLSVHWDFDYTLRLYPVPDLVVIGDKSESYQGEYKGCHVVNPGSFCDSGFQFKAYTPFNNSLDDCVL